MPSMEQLLQTLEAGGYDKELAIYDDIPAARARIKTLCARFKESFGDEGDFMLFSAPGRTEIGGNHTDHNNGRVLAGAVNLDALALARKSDKSRVRLHSAGFEMNVVELETLEPRAGERDSNSLIRGVCAGLDERGRAWGGFDAVTQSDVHAGSGLSSSAAFENLVGATLDHLYGNGDLPPVQLAQISRFAENKYMKKPSGLMDQTASAVGGLVTIDFEDNDNAVIRTVDYDFTSSGHSLVITGPIGSHAGLTEQYASIPLEMRQVAAHFGKKVLREVAPEQFFADLHSLYGKLTDRAILRAIHFFEENERVSRGVHALETGDFQMFLNETAASGRSSYMYLQNVVTQTEQGLGVALALSERVLNGQGASRVHGGGFAGTIQAFVPDSMVPVYVKTMEDVFGKGTCMRLRIRKEGAVRVL